ncbi:MAG: hypothetical protein WAS54_09390 [Scrofimicrobium sp.]
MFWEGISADDPPILVGAWYEHDGTREPATNQSCINTRGHDDSIWANWSSDYALVSLNHLTFCADLWFRRICGIGGFGLLDLVFTRGLNLNGTLNRIIPRAVAGELPA